MCTDFVNIPDILKIWQRLLSFFTQEEETPMQSYMDSSMQNLDNLCRYIVQHEHTYGEIVTNLRLQKLLYFIQAECLLELKRPCFAEEIQAWRYGPTVPEAYHKYKFYGLIGIVPEPSLSPDVLLPSENIRRVVNKFLDQTRHITTEALVDITHRQAPWRDAYGAGGNYSSVITNQAILSFFNSPRQEVPTSK